MQQKEILTQILDAYSTEKNADPQLLSHLRDFCVYANKWLAQRGVVGIGHAQNGFALKFSDGQECPLFQFPEAELVDTPAVSLTGNAGGSVRSSGAIADTSFKITG